MLLGSIVFMSRTLRGQWTTIVLVFVLKLNIASTSQIPHDNVVRFSGDFEGFLKDLGSMVYKKKGVSGNELHSNYDRIYTTPSHKNYRRSQNIYNTQKAALGDVLMMKLVSYYEDKYKLTHGEPTTTESITFMDTVTNIVNKYNLDAVDTRPPLPLLHETSNLVDQSRQQTQSRHERNRRMERNMRRTYDEPIPEVVIL